MRKFNIFLSFEIFSGRLSIPESSDSSSEAAAASFSLSGLVSLAGEFRFSSSGNDFRFFLVPTDVFSEIGALPCVVPILFDILNVIKIIGKYRYCALHVVYNISRIEEW